MTESLKAAFNRQSYVGGNPSEAERLVWAYRYWRAVRVTKTGKPGFGAKEALHLARADVGMNKIRYAESAASGAYGPAFKLRGAKAMRWIEKPAACGLRVVDYADKLVRLDHTGWFLDNDNDGETARGIVYQLPGRHGKPLFVAGVADPFNDGAACLGFDDIERGASGEDCDDAKRTQAGYADQLAAWYAEDEREWRAASSAGVRYAELGEEIAADRKLALELLAERRAARDDGKAFPAICATIRQRVAEILHSIADAREKRAKLMEGEFVGDCWPSWNTSDKRLVDAFNESAGIHA
ncbi:hypothetical protein [Mesorhizobium sp. B2-8-9]|uniref:hypothetical protein n=1 Tax=Mesorhizobium sp. B2-8-9 TaxID=2589899 RepID=UPI001128ACE6|nr:hypothetical protein [Mesorhizobium sp. B2-8-9]TPI86409.1 hypothetical protein FJ423_00880 [Mesorhizobium sp. B2-8-9]